MKTTTWLLCAGLLAASASVNAQDTSKTSMDAPPRWTALTDSVGQVIGLRQDQQEGWKTRNESWNSKYQALGEHPENHPTYIKLHSAREFDLKGFLTGGQYDKWKELNKRSPRLEPNNPPGTNMPSDR
ncbi:MAG: hypothetical protein ACOH13_03375 [Flavobacteriales bacterium]